MCLGYNIVLHFSVIPINLFIILKEVSMHYFQFLNNEAGTKQDDISINFKDWDDDYEYYYNDN